MSTVIEVSNLSKAYQLGQINTGTLGTDLQRWFALKRGKEDPFLKIGETNDRTTTGGSDVVWSLKDINFTIEQGSAVGVIGRNGAGKSTLLKILSQITGPTTGSVKIKGRIASLLEVGTGFHPELSGRENIFLNGAILGMRKKEITRKFDEMVDFSGVERYIDTPVKRYSSGMYVRLAFAVAAYLESEILIIDEVLAVGDSEFQKKCLGKMDDVSKGEGRTILFVSHNMMAVKQLCSKGIYLENGTVKSQGALAPVMEKYMATGNVASYDFKPIQVKEIQLTVTKLSLNSDSEGSVEPYKPLRVDIELLAKQAVDRLGVEIMITSDDVNGLVFASNTKTRKNIDIELKEGINTVSLIIHDFNVASGTYILGLGLDIPFVSFYFYEKELLNFNVNEVTKSPSQVPTIPAYGRFLLAHDWIINGK